jgi:hypothetical protein
MDGFVAPQLECQHGLGEGFQFAGLLSSATRRWARS